VSIQISLHVKTDTMTPHLRAALSRVKNKRPVMEAMGLALVGITKRAFTDASLRAAGWPPKKDGKAATLRLTGTMWRSVRITQLTDRRVVVGSDRKYAAVHQLGGRKMKPAAKGKRKGGGRGGIPARPFFPFTPDGRATQRAKDAVTRAGKAAVERLLKG
jgi:phage gpG-like protein